MQTRRDLYQAHKLMMQRVSLALLSGEPDLPESPMRRLTVAALSGAMVAVLIAAVYGIIGLLRGGGTNGIEQPGTLIIEKETGTRFAWSARDRKLIQFVNYTSALLALQTDNPKTKTVSRQSLAKYTRGPVSGILGAPDSLPDPDKPAKAPWSLCVRRADNGRGGTTPVVTLVGGRNVGGRTLAGDEAVVVTAANQPWLIYNNQRMRLTPSGLRALGVNQPAPVSDVWLNGINPGNDFVAPPIPGRGRTGPGPNGQQAPVGQVYRVQPPTGGASLWYVQLTDGPALISESQANLLLSDPLSKDVPTPRQVQAAQLGKLSPQRIKALPDTMPRPTVYDPVQPLCAVYSGTDSLTMDARLAIGGTLPEVATTAVAPPTRTNTGVIDQIDVPGSGTLAGQLTTAKVAPQTFFILTDQGLKFPIPKADDLKKLGFDAGKASPVPSNLLRLIPQGPALVPADALKPVPATGTTSSGSP
ncbi:MAG TPA: type VII secretion protein EccB [Streptosporangiaceae bacterium]|nr:type VII secretion protein EccB [Streptosporangiaceae bacterium]